MLSLYKPAKTLWKTLWKRRSRKPVCTEHVMHLLNNLHVVVNLKRLCIISGSMEGTLQNVQTTGNKSESQVCMAYIRSYTIGIRKVCIQSCSHIRTIFQTVRTTCMITQPSSSTSMADINFFNCVQLENSYQVYKNQIHNFNTSFEWSTFFNFIPLSLLA